MTLFSIKTWKSFLFLLLSHVPYRYKIGIYTSCIKKHVVVNALRQAYIIFLRRKLLLSCTWRLSEVKQTKTLVYFCEYRGMPSLRWTICLICFQNIRYPQHLPQFPGRLVYYCWDNERFRRFFFVGIEEFAGKLVYIYLSIKLCKFS